ncbi:hypothetical protein ACYFX5_16480 [Bremerella sp. T1]|uniref:hypothetical protein n=1 Tax=Bremerella sp. TYQ1 TaxID=3119568 RepID=UPI001CCC9AE4|nr:hypothetical protein [Bremerella volcania]UBM34655.1 hypothetical protein LA756_18430 [Bremerella volcania]
MTCTSIWQALAATLLLCAVLGCGSESGLESYPISGSITYGGKPIPAGSITFVPNSRQGNTGAAVSMEIKDGKYDSNSADHGHIGGPHLVTVVGLDGNGDGDLFPMGQMLFPDYELEIELPKETSVQDIDVPGDRKLKPRRGPVNQGP